jgi:hypothetical protein
MLEQTVQKIFLLFFLLVAAAAVAIGFSQNVNATDSMASAKAMPQVASNTGPASLDELIQASGLSQGGANPIKPLRNINGMVLLANSEGDMVGHVVTDASGTFTLKLLGQLPLQVSALR